MRKMEKISKSEKRLRTLLPWTVEVNQEISGVCKKKSTAKKQNKIEEENLFQIVMYELMKRTDDEPSVFIVQNGKIKFFFNNVFEKMSGYAQNEFIKEKLFMNLICVEDFKNFVGGFKNNSSASSFQTFRISTKNNLTRYAELTSILVQYKGNEATLNFLSMPDTENKANLIIY